MNRNDRIVVPQHIAEMLSAEMLRATWVPPPPTWLERLDRVLQFWRDSHEVLEIHTTRAVRRLIIQDIRSLGVLSEFKVFDDGEITCLYANTPLMICAHATDDCVHLKIGHELVTVNSYDPNEIRAGATIQSETSWSHTEKIFWGETPPEGLVWES